MWRLIRAAAESGRRKVRSGKTLEPVRQLLLHPRKDPNLQLRLFTSLVSFLSATLPVSIVLQEKNCEMHQIFSRRDSRYLSSNVDLMRDTLHRPFRIL